MVAVYIDEAVEEGGHLRVPMRVGLILRKGEPVGGRFYERIGGAPAQAGSGRPGFPLGRGPGSGPGAQRFPRAARLLLDAQEDIQAYMAFPTEHARQLHSTNQLERLNRETGWRADVVGIFPNTTAVIRLAGAVLTKEQDEWSAATHRYFHAKALQRGPKQQRR